MKYTFQSYASSNHCVVISFCVAPVYTPRPRWNMVVWVQSINRVSLTTVLYPNKMYRLCRKMTMNGHFLYDLYIFGIHC